MRMGEQIPRRQTPFISTMEYAKDLARIGVRVLPGVCGTFWARFDAGTMMRRPTFSVAPPAPHEVQQILWRGQATIATYLVEPDDAHPANTWLYICADQTYALDKLAPAMRRNVRRGLQELTIAPLTAGEVLAHGFQAFYDTQHRVGLSNGTREHFLRRFTARARLPEHVFLGAWREKQLAAFLSITEVDDWAEIEGSFSADALLQYRPSDTLMYSALSYYLIERRCHLVTYGVSSIQTETHAEGLHRFKAKVGFEARPVHRAFVLHPLLRPFANRLTLWGARRALHFKPGDAHLKRAEGVLACVLGDMPTLESGE